MWEENAFCIYNPGENNPEWKVCGTALGHRRWELAWGGLALPVCAIGHACLSCSVHSSAGASCLEVRSGDAELSHAGDPLLVWA